MTALAAIAGVGEAEGGAATGRRGVELGAEAALRAVDDAGLPLDAIDGLLVESPDVDQHHMSHLDLADMLRWRPAAAWSTGCGGATPFANVALGTALLQAGLATRLLVVDYDARRTFRPDRQADRLQRTAGHRNPWEDPYGPITAAKFALVARAHMQRYGTTREQLAEVTVAARANAAERPGAQKTAPVTVSQVIDSPPIAEPLHLLDCCQVSDWGAAFVLCRRDLAGNRDVDVLGHGQGHIGYAVTRSPDLARFDAIETSGQAAFAMSGLTPADMDVALLYDSFTITVLAALEGLGFCARGEGGPFLASQGITEAGVLPTNPHGGQLAYNGGHGHFVAEAVRQLRGEAPSRQVPDASVAVCQGTAAGVQSSYTVVLGRR